LPVRFDTREKLYPKNLGDVQRKSKYNTNRERETRTVAKATKSAVAGTRTQPSQVSAPMDVLEPEDQQEIAILAYHFWQERGCPIGSPEEDWFRAEQSLKATQDR
jgi:Protein of unknown function (DUF2934)